MELATTLTVNVLIPLGVLVWFWWVFSLHIKCVHYLSPFMGLNVGDSMTAFKPAISFPSSL